MHGEIFSLDRPTRKNASEELRSARYNPNLWKIPQNRYMESRLPGFTLWSATLSIILLSVGHARAQSSPATLASRGVVLGVGGPSINDVVAAMAAHSSIETKVVQKVQLFGEELGGSGRYVQLGRGTEMLVRLELQLQVAGEVGSLLEVCDGRFLYRDRQLPSGRRVSRIALRQVFARLEQQRAANGGQRLSVPLAQRLALGGLPKLLAVLADNFEFTTPRESKIGDEPVYALRGVWRPDRLALVLAGGAADGDEAKRVDLDDMPEHVPHEVVLLVGRTDLFPYRIEYLGKAQPASGSGVAGRPQTLLSMRLYEVRLGSPIDTREFIFPREVNVEDETDEFLRKFVPE